MTSCDCSVDYSEYERLRCYTVVIRKARKLYECCECQEEIKIGQRYEHTTGIDHDHYPFSVRTCIGCAALRDHYCPSGYIWGELAETIEPCIGFDYRLPPDQIPDEEENTL